MKEERKKKNNMKGNVTFWVLKIFTSKMCFHRVKANY